MDNNPPEVKPSSASSLEDFSMQAQKERFLERVSRFAKNILGKKIQKKIDNVDLVPHSENKEPAKDTNVDRFKDALTEEEILEISVLDAHSMEDIENRGKSIREKSSLTPEVSRWYEVRMNASAYAIKEVLSRWKKLEIEQIEDLKDWRNILKGVRILDIGSGSVNSNYRDLDGFYRYYMPYFAEIAAINGAEVTAVDIKPQAEYHQKLFTGIQADIVEQVTDGNLAAIPGLKGKKFDIIASRNFVGVNNTPELDHLLLLDDHIYRIRGELVVIDDFEAKLVQQLEPLLAEGGIIDLGQRRDGKWIFYRKVNGELIEEEED